MDEEIRRHSHMMQVVGMAIVVFIIVSGLALCATFLFRGCVAEASDFEDKYVIAPASTIVRGSYAGNVPEVYSYGKFIKKLKPTVEGKSPIDYLQEIVREQRSIRNEMMVRKEILKDLWEIHHPPDDAFEDEDDAPESTITKSIRKTANHS